MTALPSDKPVSITITRPTPMIDREAEYFLRIALVVDGRYRNLSKEVRFRDIKVTQEGDHVTISATAFLISHKCQLVNTGGTVATLPGSLTGPVVINETRWVPRYYDYEDGTCVYMKEDPE